MIGKSMINVSSGARGRLSCLWVGASLLSFILVLDAWVSRIPMAALVAVMVMVSVSAFRWASLLAMRLHPTSSLVMLLTVAVVVLTHDLAEGCWRGLNAIEPTRGFCQRSCQT